MQQLSQVEIGKMRQLADFLETVPVSRFLLDEWESTAATPARTMLFGLIQLEPACGFAGCAMGWAAHSKLFDGLGIDDGMLFYRGLTGFRAAARIMGIKEQTAKFLFHPDLYPKDRQEPADVASRLNSLADRVERRLKRRAAPALRAVG